MIPGPETESAGLRLALGVEQRHVAARDGTRMVGRTIPMLLKLVRAQAALVGRASKRLAGSTALIHAMMRVGLVSETIDMDIFRIVAGGFQTVDWVIYSDLLARLGEHDAEEVLPTIDVPVSIVTGDNDLLTPPGTPKHMHRAIPGWPRVGIEGGTQLPPAGVPDAHVT